MQKRIGLVLATTLTVGAAAVASAATVEKTSFSGSQATTGFFFASTPVDCNGDGQSDGDAFLVGDIFGSQSVAKSIGSRPQFNDGLDVEVFSYSNPCTNVFASGSAGIAGGFKAPNPQLNGATMSGVGTLQDFSGQSFPLSVDLQLKGVGPVSSSSGSQETKTVGGPGGNIYISIVRSANSNRSASATGTIVVDGVTFVINSDSGLLIGNGSSTLTIQR
jgi:hypothetical protein